MRDMRPVAEGIEHEHIEPFQESHACGRDSVGVGAIGHVADAEAEDIETGAMREADGRDSRSEQIERVGVDSLEVELRGSAGVCVLAIGKGVIERLANAGLDCRFAVERHGVAQIERKEAQVVEAEDVVGVLVREEDRVDDADALAEKLLPQVGRGVDEEIALRQAEEGGAAGAFVAGVGTGADFARAADGRHADAGSRSQQDELAADIGSKDFAGHVVVVGAPKNLPEAGDAIRVEYFIAAHDGEVLKRGLYYQQSVEWIAMMGL